MAYQAKNYDRLLGVTGLSDQLLKNHFTLYQGYVTNTNNLTEKLATFSKEGKTDIPEYAELKRRFGWEFNGMRLHEYYFDNLVKGGSTLDNNSPIARQLTQDFGSVQAWEKDFRATGAARGIGWVILYQDKTSNRSFNTWINEHDVGHLAGCNPLLVMDVFEHAYMLDYGTKKAGYLDVFFKAIDWGTVNRRLTP